MDRRISILVMSFALVMSWSTEASAQRRIANTEVLTSDSSVELRVQTTEPMTEPRLRIERGRVRVWFPHTSARAFDHAGDGRLIRSVRIRAGYGDTSVSIIELADRRVLPSEAVSVERTGAITRIRIDRSFLAPAVAPAASAATSVQAEVPATVNEEATQAEALQAEDLAEPAAAESTDATEESEPTPPLSMTRSSSGAALLSESDGPSSTMILLVLTMLLGGGYMALRLVQKKMGKAAKRPEIEILASKRLGGRHQLLVVRALGEDHLLSVNGGRTEKIASVPTHGAPAERDDQDEDADGSGGGGGIPGGLLPYLRKHEAERNNAGQERAASTALGARPKFGADLMRLASERSRGDSVSVNLQSEATNPVTSEAVAGLLRLRQQAGL